MGRISRSLSHCVTVLGRIQAEPRWRAVRSAQPGHGLRALTVREHGSPPAAGKEIRMSRAGSVREEVRVETFARQHRSWPTASEERLWLYLRQGALGVVFRRQVVIGRFIADFASHAARLVVEVDGASHRGREARDARRDMRLRRDGWRVVRVTAEEVMTQPEVALARVKQALR